MYSTIFSINTHIHTHTQTHTHTHIFIIGSVHAPGVYVAEPLISILDLVKLIKSILSS